MGLNTCAFRNSGSRSKIFQNHWHTVLIFLKGCFQISHSNSILDFGFLNYQGVFPQWSQCMRHHLLLWFLFLTFIPSAHTCGLMTTFHSFSPLQCAHGSNTSKSSLEVRVHEAASRLFLCCILLMHMSWSNNQSNNPDSMRHAVTLLSLSLCFVSLIQIHVLVMKELKAEANGECAELYKIQKCNDRTREYSESIHSETRLDNWEAQNPERNLVEDVVCIPSKYLYWPQLLK